MVKYYLRTIRKIDGKILHTYHGRVNANACPKEPIMERFSDNSYQAFGMEKMHEKIMKLNSRIKKLETIVVEKT